MEIDTQRPNQLCKPNYLQPKACTDKTQLLELNTVFYDMVAHPRRMASNPKHAQPYREQPHGQGAIGQQGDPFQVAGLSQGGLKGAAGQAVGVLQRGHTRQLGVTLSCTAEGREAPRRPGCLVQTLLSETNAFTG